MPGDVLEATLNEIPMDPRKTALQRGIILPILRDDSIIAISRILPPPDLPATSFLSICPDESVGYLLSRVRSTMSSELQQLTQAEFDLSSTQASMLMLLKHGQLSGADLAREYGIDASAVTRLLDKLERRGLVVRTRSESDRRVVHLALTPEGWQVIEGLRPLYAKVLDRMMADFTQEEAGFLKSLLRRIILNCETTSTK